MAFTAILQRARSDQGPSPERIRRSILQDGIFTVRAIKRRSEIAKRRASRSDACMSGWRFALIRSSVALLLLVSTSASDTWHAFRGNPQLTGIAQTDVPSDLHLLWTYATEDAIESTAAIHQNTVYLPSLDTHLYALDLDTGTLQWRYQASAEIKSSPTIIDSTLYFGDEAGTLHAIDLQTGQPRWTFAAEGAITSSANYAGDRLYFGSYDQYLYCLDAATGAEAWKIASDGYIHSTPVIYQDQVASAGCDGQLRLLDQIDGSERRALPMGAYVAASAAVAGNRAYVGTFGNEVLAVDLDAGTVAWRYQHPERKFPFYASPAVGADVVVIGGRDKMVHALDPDTGAEIWRFETGAEIAASPAVAQGRLVIGTTDGAIYCFGAKAP